jgi:hypothetical protein
MEDTAYQKLDLFPSSGMGTETLTLLGPLEKANLNHWIWSDWRSFFLGGSKRAGVSLLSPADRNRLMPETLCLLVI